MLALFPSLGAARRPTALRHQRVDARRGRFSLTVRMHVPRVCRALRSTRVSRGGAGRDVQFATCTSLGPVRQRFPLCDAAPPARNGGRGRSGPSAGPSLGGRGRGCRLGPDWRKREHRPGGECSLRSNARATDCSNRRSSAPAPLESGIPWAAKPDSCCSSVESFHAKRKSRSTATHGGTPSAC